MIFIQNPQWPEMYVSCWWLRFLFILPSYKSIDTRSWSQNHNTEQEGSDKIMAAGKTLFQAGKIPRGKLCLLAWAVSRCFMCSAKVPLSPRGLQSFCRRGLTKLWKTFKLWRKCVKNPTTCSGKEDSPKCLIRNTEMFSFNNKNAWY